MNTTLLNTFMYHIKFKIVCLTLHIVEILSLISKRWSKYTLRNVYSSLEKQFLSACRLSVQHL